MQKPGYSSILSNRAGTRNSNDHYESLREATAFENIDDITRRSPTTKHHGQSIALADGELSMDQYFKQNRNSSMVGRNYFGGARPST